MQDIKNQSPSILSMTMIKIHKESFDPYFLLRFKESLISLLKRTLGHNLEWQLSGIPEIYSLLFGM